MDNPGLTAWTCSRRCSSWSTRILTRFAPTAAALGRSGAAISVRRARAVSARASAAPGSGRDRGSAARARRDRRDRRTGGIRAGARANLVGLGRPRPQREPLGRPRAVARCPHRRRASRGRPPAGRAGGRAKDRGAPARGARPRRRAATAPRVLCSIAPRSSSAASPPRSTARPPATSAGGVTPVARGCLPRRRSACRARAVAECPRSSPCSSATTGAPWGSRSRAPQRGGRLRGARHSLVSTGAARGAVLRRTAGARRPRTHPRRPALPHDVVGRTSERRGDGPRGCEARLDHVAICDHTPAVGAVHGLTSDDVHRQGDEIAAANELLAPFRVLRGIECDILADGRLDLADDTPAELDGYRRACTAGSGCRGGR